MSWAIAEQKEAPGPRFARPLVFIAAKYEGNPFEYLNGLVHAAVTVWGLGAVPVLPLPRLSLLDAAERLRYERALIDNCRAVLIVSGDEDGDQDLIEYKDRAEDIHIPVFADMVRFLHWLTMA